MANSCGVNLLNLTTEHRVQRARAEGRGQNIRAKSISKIQRSKKKKKSRKIEKKINRISLYTIFAIRIVENSSGWTGRSMVTGVYCQDIEGDGGHQTHSALYITNLEYV